ncbi:PREDICTED: sperm acrosome membrane-associated protein 6-like [Poecilia mexicana]|uniref:sperm acrosome membrane-associated protein 6-like n=1 Tax=Poecilia mexicana TaxID=48701 RepID=UPI00072EE51F|nr:PREDICTED: sperm acrosome membrane-associated protein 6-like [Poecilia mexicana]
MISSHVVTVEAGFEEKQKILLSLELLLKICMAVLWLASVSLLICPSLSCYICFIKPQVSGRLCTGYIVEETNVNSVDECFRMLDRIFNTNETVIEAGRVAGGLEGKLKEILEAEILPIAREFQAKWIMDTVYESRLQKAADNFIAAASKLPRDTQCIPPCGFQNIDAAYNCDTCQYDSCLFPLDCPVEETEVMEGRGIEMRCDVPFDLPNDIEVVWRFAEQFKTQETEQFKEVTAGPDRLYFISSTSSQHTGTYQCEIFSGTRSIVRLYFYITVTPRPVAGHTALQGIFDLSLLPRGQLLTAPGAAPHFSLHLLLFLLTTCLASSLLLLFVSLGFLYWLSVSEVDHPVADSDEEDYFGVSMLAI